MPHRTPGQKYQMNPANLCKVVLLSSTLTTGVTANLGNPGQVGTGSSPRNAMSGELKESIDYLHVTGIHDSLRMDVASVIGGSSPFNQPNERCGGLNDYDALQKRKGGGFGKSRGGGGGGGGSSAASTKYPPYSLAALTAAAAAGLTGGLLP